MDKNSLAHTKWNCKYHIVITPKYRRQIIYKDISRDIGSIIRTLCARKGVEIIEAAAMPDHIHLYVAIPPKYAVSDFMGYLKGKSSLMIFDRHAYHSGALRHRRVIGPYRASASHRLSRWS